MEGIIRFTAKRFAIVLTIVVAALSGCGSSTTRSDSSTGTTTSTSQPPESSQARHRREVAAAKAKAAEDRKHAAEARAAARRQAAEVRAERAREAHEEAARKLEEHAGEGLGATTVKFKAHNSEQYGEPVVGTASYHITATNEAGRVVAYEVAINASPPFSSREVMLLLAGVDLPDDSEIVHETDRCIVWRSPLLQHLIGHEYAEATTETESQTARMEATSVADC